MDWFANGVYRRQEVHFHRLLMVVDKLLAVVSVDKTASRTVATVKVNSVSLTYLAFSVKEALAQREVSVVPFWTGREVFRLH